jgi:hypothetical protein
LTARRTPGKGRLVWARATYCASRETPFTIVLRDNGFDAARGAAAGRGHAVLQVYARTVGTKALARQAKERRRLDRAYMRTKLRICEKCIGHWRRCVIANPDIQHGKCAAFNRCVRRHSGKPSLCRMNAFDTGRRSRRR